MALSVMEDVSCILCGPQPLCHCTATQALSDLHCLLSSAAALLHSVKGMFPLSYTHIPLHTHIK